MHVYVPPVFQETCGACHRPMTAKERTPNAGRRCKTCVKDHVYISVPLSRNRHKRIMPNPHAAPPSLMDFDVAVVAAAAAPRSSSSEPESRASSPLAGGFSHDEELLDHESAAASASAPSAAAAAAPASAAPAAGRTARPLAVSKSSRPLEGYPDDVLSCFLLYGFARFRGSELDALFSGRVAGRAAHKTPRAGVTTISGSVRQLDLTKQKGFVGSELAQEWNKMVYATAAQLHLRKEDAKHMIAPKLLTAAPNTGLQGIHWDSDAGPFAARTLNSAIVYCTVGSSSWLPRFPLSVYPRHDSDLASKRALNFSSYLSLDWFHCVPVEPGDSIIFWQGVPHYGPHNDSQVPRLVGFTMISHSDDPKQDAEQVCFTHAARTVLSARVTSLMFPRLLVCSFLLSCAAAIPSRLRGGRLGCGVAPARAGDGRHCPPPSLLPIR